MTVIRRRSEWVPTVIGDAYRYRDLLMTFFRRDIALRYRQTLVGPAWVLIQPLLSAGIFTFVFGSVAKLGLPGHVPYFVFSLLGMSLWTGFSNGVTRGTSITIGNMNLVTKVYFPRILLPVSAVLSSSLDALVMLAVAAVALVLSGVGIRVSFFLVLPLLLGCQLLGLGMAAFFGSLLVRFRDISYGVPVLVQALMFLTPVVYSLSSVPNHLQPIVRINPLTFYFQTLRWASLPGSPPPSLGTLLFGISATVILSFVGVSIFTRLQWDFADII